MASEKQGSVFGGILLIGGSCIGAGMLGLPILTGMAGFFPSLLMFILAAFFMTTTGLFLVEVNSFFPGKVNFITMVFEMLGPLGRIGCWILYLFLFYALSVAYIAGSGNHIADLIPEIPPFIGSTLFVLLFGSLVYFGTRPVDLVNRWLMAGKILAYIGLLITGAHYVQGHLLKEIHLEKTLAALPILVISFGFHNMIPTLSHYLGGDTERVRISIVGGALFALTVYLFWQVIALGSLPLEGENGILASYAKGIDAAQAIKAYIGAPWIGTFAETLAFFAILTSFLAQTLALVHFLSDGLKVSSAKREHIGIVALALLPPLVLASIYPTIFYEALNFAGGISAVILFGIFPVLMIFVGRYQKKLPSTYEVGGGKKMLALIFVIACFILGYQIFQMV